MTGLSEDAERQTNHEGATTSDESVPTVMRDLDGWTSDELFAEALKRRAGDPSALRVMQELTLRAQLTAHSRE